MAQSLASLNTMIETPFITAKFGGVEFGVTSKVDAYGVRATRYVESLQIERAASGMVNKYSLTLNYTIKPGEDPNYIDYIISQDKTRTIEFSYGDLSTPIFARKNEKAMITTAVPNIQFASSKIDYTIAATSSVAVLYSLRRSYQSRVDKPSNIINQLLYIEVNNGLLDLFIGMQDKENVRIKGWLATDDLAVEIPAKSDISPLEYIRFLVGEMKSDTGFYVMVIHDSFDTEQGTYFEIVHSTKAKTVAELEVDVGYPSNGSLPIFNFQAKVDSSYALITPLLTKYDTNRVININNAGELLSSSTPSLAIRNGLASSSLQSWWNKMTNYPVTATLSTRGLIIPALLCQNIKVNVLFYGQKYNLSGYYMVVGQSDSVSSVGYRTDLSLIRVSGD